MQMRERYDVPCSVLSQAFIVRGDLSLAVTKHKLAYMFPFNLHLMWPVSATLVPLAMPWHCIWRITPI